jgi:hypothetical protein
MRPFPIGSRAYWGGEPKKVENQSSYMVMASNPNQIHLQFFSFPTPAGRHARLNLPLSFEHLSFPLFPFIDIKN